MGGAYWILRGAVEALFAVPWAFLYQAPIAFLVAYLVLRQQGFRELRGRAAVILAALTGGGAALVFAVHLLLGILLFRMTLPGAPGVGGRPFFPMFGALPALVISWWLVAHVIDRGLNLDLESNHRIVARIFGPTLLAWIGIGLLIIIINNP